MVPSPTMNVLPNPPEYVVTLFLRGRRRKRFTHIRQRRPHSVVHHPQAAQQLLSRVVHFALRASSQNPPSWRARVVHLEIFAAIVAQPPLSKPWMMSMGLAEPLMSLRDPWPTTCSLRRSPD